MALVPLPDGSAVKVRPGETEQQAWARAQQMYPEAFGIEQQHGFMGALGAGARQGFGAGLRGIGSLTGSTGAEQLGQQILNAPQEPGAWRPTTSEDVDTGFKHGVMSGIGAFMRKNITEPLGSAFGRYVLPTAAGAAAAALVPEAAIPLALSRGLGFMAADAPSDLGENIQRNEEVAQRTGQPVRPVDAETIAASLAQAALLPVLGPLGNKAAGYFKLLGPDLAQTAKAVAEGRMTQKAAEEALNSTAKNLLVRTGENAVVGAGLMTGTEALRTAQSGEDVTGHEAMERYGESLKAAAAFAPLGGAMGAWGARGRQERAVEGAGKQFGATWDEAAAQNEQLKQATAQKAPIEGTPEGTQLGLGLEGQPATGQLDNIDAMMATAQKELAALNTLKKAQEDVGDPVSAKQTSVQIKAKVRNLETLKQAKRASMLPGEPLEAAPDQAQVVPKGFFNSIGVGNDKRTKNELRVFEGKDLSDPDLHTAYVAALDSLTSENPPMWMTREKEAALRSLTDSQQGLGLPTGESVRNAFFNKKGNAILQVQANKDRRQARIDQNTQDAVQGAAARKASTNAQTHQQMQDMFTGEMKPVDMSPEAPRAPVDMMPEFTDRNAELYNRFQQAQDRYQKTGDAAELKAVLAQAKEELGPYNEQLNQASTQKMFDARGKPTARAKAYGTDRTEGTVGREGDGVPVLESPRGGNAAAEPIARRVDTGAQDNEAAPVGQEPVERALSTQQQIDALAGKKDSRSNERRAQLLIKRNEEKRLEAQGAARAKQWGVVLTPEEKEAAAKAKQALGANEAQVPGETGLGGAARAETLHEFLPTQFRLSDRGIKGQQNTWWNDLAQMVTDAQSAKGKSQERAKQAIKIGLARKTFTTEHLAQAVAKNARIVAQQEMLRKASERREAARVAADKASHSEAKAMKKTGIKEAESIAKQIEAQKEKEKENIVISKQTEKEEQARSSEEEVDPEIARAERELARAERERAESKAIEEYLKKIPPDAVIAVEQEGHNGEIVVTNTKAKAAGRAKARETKIAEAVLACAIKGNHA